MKAVSALVALALALSGFATTTPGEMILTATEAERHNLLSNDDWKFDFYNNKNYLQYPGSVISSDSGAMAATTGQGGSVMLITLGPCSFIPVHTHPRASHFAFVSKGPGINTTAISENGANVVTANVKMGQMTIFPAGSIHMMLNNECGVTEVVSSLPSPDGGTLLLSTALNAMPQEYVALAFGAPINSTALANKLAGGGPAAQIGTPECLARCKIDPKTGKPL